MINKSKYFLLGHFIFHEFGISAKSGFFDFYLPKNTNHVSGSIKK
jgi:hypothetical protein